MTDLIGEFHVINCSNLVIGLTAPKVNGVSPKMALADIST